VIRPLAWLDPDTHADATVGTRITLSPVTAPHDRRPGDGQNRGGQGGGPRRRPRVRLDRRGRRRHRVWVLLACLVVLLGGTLAATAWADSGTPPPATPAANSAPPLPLPTVDTCDPGSPIPACALPTATSVGTPPATSAAVPPCTGEGCIPQPNPPPATGQPGGGGNGSGSAGGSDCGIFDPVACISAAINGLFAGLVNAALGPVLDLLGQTVLSTPTLDQLPGVAQLWDSNWQLVLGIYGLLIIIGGIIVMAHETVQTRYSIKDIGPRIILGFLASALSLFFADKIIRLVNALTLAVLGSGVAPTSLGDTLQQAITGVGTGSLFLILIALVLVVLGLALALVYVVRVIITLVLIISGPLFLMCHALPHTDPIARWWWKAIGLTAAIQLGQSLVLVVAIRVILTGGVRLFSSPLSSTGFLFAAGGLFYVLFKIPFWFLSAARGGSRRSMLGGLLRAYVMARALGAVGARTGAFGRAGAAASGGRGRRGGSAAAGGLGPLSPLPPRVAATPAQVSRRLREQYEAERLRAARRSRIPSQAPRFLQPTPQVPTRDHATGAATEAPAMPEFSAPVTPATATGQRPRPAAPPFRAPGTTRHPPHQHPIRTATVPPALRFQPPAATTPTTASATASRPTRASGPPPVAEFRTATRQPHFGATPPRTPTPAPVQFRAPTRPPAPRTSRPRRQS